ncbi:hypothetical protein UlMin_035323 [Ulmus minor]
MIPPEPSQPLLLYIAVTESSLGALIAQEKDGVERPVYYLSRLVRGAEYNYSLIEKQCLALVYVAQRLRHYMLAHKVCLMSKSNPFRYMMNNPIPSSRLTRWILALSEFDIRVISPTAKRSQALAELLATFPTAGGYLVNDEVLGEAHKVATIEEEQKWQLMFDRAATAGKGGIGIVLIGPESQVITKACKMMYGCSNNEAEYEALITGLELAASKGVTHLVIKGDSHLVIQQLKGEFAVKELALTKYRAKAQQILQNFQAFHFEHVPRSQNRYADALATLASRIDDQEVNRAVIIVEAKDHEMMQAPYFPKDQWIKDMKVKILEGKMTNYKTVRQFHIESGILYYKSSTGVWARCVSKQEATQRLKEVHEQTCGTGGAPLARRLLRAGYYWEGMQNDAQEIQKNCGTCKLEPTAKEAVMLIKINDWRKPYIDYLTKGLVPDDKTEEVKIKRHAVKYVMKEDSLYRKAYSGDVLRCINGQEVEEVLREIHEGDCGEHQGGRRLYEEILRLGYFWPTMENDAMDYARRCKSCQFFGDKIHAPAVTLHTVNAPWPFHTWALDLIGPISPPSKGRIWILTATENFTKWAEAISLKKASSKAVAMFIMEHIICRFDIPRRVLTNNGMPFIGKDVKKLLEDYRVHHGTSTRYYP